MQSFALRGNILYTPAPERLELQPQGYLVCREGSCGGVFPALPEEFSGLSVQDFGDALIVPGYTDLHLHAPQYGNMGLGTDEELLDWLEKYTYPAEAAFSDLRYADAEYGRFTEELRNSFTVRAVVFATSHTPATLRLMEKLERSGLRSLVGKVSMDRNCPEGLRESSARAALEAVEDWLAAAAGRFENVSPVLSPRFVPSCSMELLEGLGALSKRQGLPVQSHLSETPDEVAWVRALHPDSASYTDIYRRCGLLGERTVMAHCVYLEEHEVDIIKETGTFVAHCPVSNTDLRSGIAPVRRYLDAGVRVGLGSDVSGGHTLDMSEVVRQALAVSRLLWRTGGGGLRPLSPREGFYLATRGGGAFFGRAGSFEPGFAFDALVVDDGRVSPPGRYSLEERFERMVFLCSGRDLLAKFVGSKRLF